MKTTGTIINIITILLHTSTNKLLLYVKDVYLRDFILFVFCFFIYFGIVICGNIAVYIKRLYGCSEYTYW